MVLHLRAPKGKVSVEVMLNRAKYFDRTGKVNDHTIYLSGNLGKNALEFAMCLSAKAMGGRCLLYTSRCPYTMKICEVQASPVTTYSETHCCRCWLECMDETKITVSGEEAALEDSMAGSHFYPDFAAVLLKQKVAEQYGLKAENVPVSYTHLHIEMELTIHDL